VLVSVAAVCAAAAAFVAPATAAGKSYCINGQTVTLSDSEQNGFLAFVLDNTLAAGFTGGYSKEDPAFEGQPDSESESFVDQWLDQDDLVLISIDEELGVILDQHPSSEGWTFNSIAAGACPQGGGGGAPPQGPDRYIYCAVAGNTWPDGTPIAPGTSLNLPADQANNDPHYKGATIGFFVKGRGATCSLDSGQAAIAAGSTQKVNHTGGTGDPNQPEVYTLIG
jgi:hypothetical protein